jgi:hypothetical protein
MVGQFDDSDLFDTVLVAFPGVNFLGFLNSRPQCKFSVLSMS